jgi:hypothetical protein
MNRLSLLIAIAACGPRAEAPDGVVRALDSGANLVVARDGIYVAGDHLVRLDHPAQLDDALRVQPGRQLQLATLTTAPLPSIASVIREAKRAGWPRIRITTNADDRMRLVCTTDWSQPSRNPGRTILSVDVRPDQIFVGLAPANDFYVVEKRGDGPDLDKLYSVLRDRYESDTFRRDERRDAEIAAAPGITTPTYLDVVGKVCDAGFIDLAFVEPMELAAHAGF